MMARSQNLLTGLLIVGACLAPLILWIALVPVAGGFAALGYSPVVVDGFSWVRGIFVVTAGALALALGIARVRDNGAEATPLDLILVIVAGLAMFSSFATPYKALGYTGVPYMFDGLWTFLSYLALAFAATKAGPALGKWLPWGLGITILFVAAVALPEASGINVLDHELFSHRLFRPAPGLTARYAGNFQAASIPFGNPNYLGAFAAMVWPLLSLTVFAPLTAKARSFFAVTGALALALLLASGTRSAMVGGSMGVVTALGILFGTRKSINLRQLSCFLLSTLAGFCLFYFTAQGNPLRRVKAITRSFVTEEELALRDDAIKGSDESIVQIHGRLRVASKGAVVLIERFPDNIKFMTESYRPILYRTEGNHIVLPDETYRSWTVTKAEVGGFSGVNINGMTIVVTHLGFRVLRGNMLIKPIIGESYALPIADRALARRGFIWSRTLPLLKNKWFYGSGPAAFPFEFPNDDVGAKIKNLGFQTLVDKPHSLYLSWAFNYGIIAAILLLVVILSIWGRLAWKIIYHNQALLGKGLPFFASIMAFLIASTCTDSTVGVSAPFWIILGSCVGLMKILPVDVTKNDQVSLN